LKDVLVIAGCIAFVAAMFAGVWWLFYFLWNEIAAGIFGGPELTFWQSVGLLVLVGILTSGLRAAKSKD